MTAELVSRLSSISEGGAVTPLSTSQVLFLLAAQPRHQAHVKAALDLIRERWAGECVVPSVSAHVLAETEARYHINIFWSDKDGVYVADIPDLEYCTTFGATPEQALAEVLKAKEVWLEVARKRGKPIPDPNYQPYGD